MNGKAQADPWRPAASMAIWLATLYGCATGPAFVRDSQSTDPAAPDLLNVSAVAPAINAGPTGLAGSPLRPTRPLSASGTRSAAASDKAVAPVSALPTLPQLPAAYGSNALARPDVNLNAGLMGPTPPVATPAASTPPTIPQSAAPFPIDLSAALRLADVQNPVIGEARILILGALAERQAARALLLPYLNAGTNYHDHTGPLQRSSGTILRLNEQSLYFGGGARTVAAESVAIPAVNIFSPLTDAIFEPLAAQQRVIGARFNASDTSNKVLLEVASLYIDLIGAEAILEARRGIAAEADKVAASVAAYAATGQGRKSDSERAEADRRLFQADIQKAEERFAVASALLAERLNLDPSAQLRPIAGHLEPIELINPETPPEDLIRSAVTRRPDLAAREALVNQAEFRVREEKARPLLPTLWLGFSGGAFGGGSNLTATPLGSFAGRTDFDVRLYWTVLNLGAGNASLIKRRKAEAGQAMADRSRVINQVRSEVATARAESLALRFQVTNARFGLRSAEDGYRQDQTRLRETLALPIEALDSLRLLSDARVALIQAITRANRTQFALFVSLGAPPPLDTPPVGSSLPPLASGGS
jgi:outer membrane protein TolC